MSTYDKIRKLPLTIDSYAVRPCIHGVNGVFGNRKTTVFELYGQGFTGVGEDVTYHENCQESLWDTGPVLTLAGSYTFDEFSRHLDTFNLFPDAPKTSLGAAFCHYRRWALESAALDLALQQNNTNLADVLGLELKPLNFVASLRLGEPSSFEPIKRRLEQYPNMRFKLDPVNDWTDELIEQIAATGAVETMDFKGFYSGMPVDVETNPELYAKIVEAFPDAWLEDPDVNDETRAILEPHSDRVTWDFPIHDVKSIDGQAFKPKTVNIKPSRFGVIRELFAAYDYCRKRGITMYSGGQTEIGPGRGQVQYLSALFHPEGPNDIAPMIYNCCAPSTELPPSPLVINPKPFGFGIPEQQAHPAGLTYETNPKFIKPLPSIA